ncbi:hypothetical protein [Rubrivirga sp. IMCC45206]|uniref:hypothetical protein n=1 Tax=Rubrivirga sp. IMCC45206 TaxID=3391614 RepID=UPI0039900FBB
MRPALTLAAAQLRADLRHARSGRRGAGRLATTAIAYGFSGVVLALSLGNAPPVNALFVSASFGIVLAAFGVVGSYDELMGRPRDNAWLATLPATERSHYTARLLGVGVYVGLMAVGVAVPVGIRVAIAHGPGSGLLVALATAGATVWTALLALALLWGLTLVLPRRALRVTLSLGRTALIAGLVLGFQLIGSSPDALGASWWPGAWIADTLGGRPTVGLALLGASLFTFGIAFGAVFPQHYFRLLRKLADGATREGRQSRLGRQMTAPERLAVRRGPLRAAYGFATAAFADDRLVRGRLWPAALLPAGFVIFGLVSGGLGSIAGYAHDGALAGALLTLQNPETQLHLSILVVLIFCVQTLVQTLQTSDHADASWVFGTLPDARTAVVQVGAQTALAWRVLFPLHVGIAVLLTVAMPAADAVLTAALWFGLASLFSRLMALAHRSPPFSRSSDRFNAAARFGPLVASIPLGIGTLVLQVWAFASLPRALGVVAGLLAASALLTEATVRWPQRRPAPPTPLAPSTPAPAVAKAA